MKWLCRIVGALILIAASGLLAWIFWPAPRAGERELLHLVPDDAIAVALYRGLGSDWPACKRSAFFQSCRASLRLPVAAGFLAAREITPPEEAVLDLVGERAVCFVTAARRTTGPGGICLLAPVSPRVKWLWLRVVAGQWKKSFGYRIRSATLDGVRIQEISPRQTPEIHLRFARLGNVAAVSADWDGDSLADLIRARQHGSDVFDDFGSTEPNARQVGLWRKPAGSATWVLSEPAPDRIRLRWSLTKQHSVRIPWDATRGPRSMALIQKLFPDQGVLTVRGRVSQWMAAWDNVGAWFGLPDSVYLENLLVQMKYGEHLSHGQFPWSGAGDEMACVVGAATADTPSGWPSIVGALRCWEPRDTQMALDQDLASLSKATGEQFVTARSAPDPGLYLVQAQSGEKIEPLFCYRYAAGLVVGANSTSAMRTIDPWRFDDQPIKSTPPENQLYCRADEMARALAALTAWKELAGSDPAIPDLGFIIPILRTLSEIRLSVSIEKDTVEYALEARVRRTP